MLHFFFKKASLTGLNPLPPIWPKLWKILKNINYFMASKSDLALKYTVIMEFALLTPPTLPIMEFSPFFFNEGFP